MQQKLPIQDSRCINLNESLATIKKLTIDHSLFKGVSKASRHQPWSNIVFCTTFLVLARYLPVIASTAITEAVTTEEAVSTQVKIEE